MTNNGWHTLGKHFAANPPASREAIEKVESELTFLLPRTYMEFLLQGNGGEGFIGETYVILWKVEELVSSNVAYKVPEYAPGIFLFGSNGGGEAFGFDTSFEAGTIISIPFITMEKKNVIAIAPDFEAFLSGLSA